TMGVLCQKQADEIKDAIRKAKDQFIDYDKKIREKTVNELERSNSEVKELKNSITQYLQKNHSKELTSVDLGNLTLLQLIGLATSSLRDLETKIIAVSIETSEENISAGVEQVKNAKDKADEALRKLQDIKKGLQILAKFINMAGAIAVAITVPNIG